MAYKIIDFERHSFIHGCRDFIRNGKISTMLSNAISEMSPGQLDYIKKDMDDESKKVIDLAVKKIKETLQSEILKNKRYINLVCQSSLDNLEIDNPKFIISEVMSRYRETINPIKALFYDFQEIIFLYDNKPKNSHHKKLIERFSSTESLKEIVSAIETDIKNLEKCKEKIAQIQKKVNYSITSDYSKRVIETYAELIQWKKLFDTFPEWVNENDNKEETEKPFFLSMKKYFKD